MFVVFHHMWLTSWTSFPREGGPWWLGWLLYGHMAVAVFIVVSGFSLALAPLGNAGRLSGGVRRFLRRRAWRILPAYWAALVLSVLVTAILLRPDYGPGAMAQTLGVHGLLLQDVVGSQTPNGALWSIAIEWQIYFVFPVILLLARRTDMVRAVALTAIVVIMAHAVAGLGGPLDKINGLTPQFLALFALGALAVWIAQPDRAARLRRPLAAATLVALGSFVALAIAQGSEWMVANFFWMDLLFGVGIAALLAVIHMGGAVPIRRVLASRVGFWVGTFSYSIYLVHDPIIGVLNKYVVGPMGASPLTSFAVMVAVGVPVVLALSYGFHLLFEAPFLRNRSLSAFRTLPILRLVPKVPRPVTRGEEIPAPAVVSAAQPHSGAFMSASTSEADSVRL